MHTVPLLLLVLPKPLPQLQHLTLYLFSLSTLCVWGQMYLCPYHPRICAPLQHACMHAGPLNCHRGAGWDKTEPQTSRKFGAKGGLKTSPGRLKTGPKRVFGFLKWSRFTFGGKSFHGRVWTHFEPMLGPNWGLNWGPNGAKWTARGHKSGLGARVGRSQGWEPKKVGRSTC